MGIGKKGLTTLLMYTSVHIIPHYPTMSSGYNAIQININLPVVVSGYRINAINQRVMIYVNINLHRLLKTFEKDWFYRF